MKRLPGMPPAPGRQRGSNSGKTPPPRPSKTRGGDLDLTSALREREANAQAQPDPPKTGTRRPAIRTGGRVRMDAPTSTRVGPRVSPIPGAPRYRRNRKSRNLRAILLGIVAVIVMVAALIFGFTSPYLAIRSVEFNGITPQAAATLQSQLRINPIGHNLFAFDLLHGRAIRRQVESSEADFASASVGIRFPRTLVVNVYSRHPYALLAVGATGAQGFYILDDHGVPIRDEHGVAPRPGGMPKITALEDPLTDGTQPAVPVILGKPLPPFIAQQVAQAYMLLNAIKTRPALGTAASIQVDKSLNLGLNMTNHLRIKLGQISQLSRKLDLTGSLLTQHPEFVTQAQYIDMSDPDHPAMLPRPAVIPSVPGAVAQQTAPGGDSLGAPPAKP